MKTRREKLAALAATGKYNPNEAAVAAAKLAALPASLEDIATQIKVEWGRSVESQFEIGRLLSEARAIFDAQATGPGEHSADVLFGRWFKAQGFPFGTNTGWHYRIGYERREEVRALLASEMESRGAELGLTRAVQLLIAKPKPQAEVGPTADVDPAYAALRNARNRIVGDDGGENAFDHMHVDDLVKSAGFIKELVTAYQEAKARR